MRVKDGLVQRGSNRLLDRAIEERYEGTGETVNYRGMEMLSSFKSLKSVDWVIGANYPTSEAYAPIRNIQKYFLVLAVLGSALILAGGRFMMARFTLALVGFAEHVRDIYSKEGPDRLFRHSSSDEIGLLVDNFNTMIQEDDQKHRALEHASTHDALTGAFNRAYFEREVERIVGEGEGPVSVVMADVDGLKICNDTHGHDVGDEVIRTAARILVESFRTHDTVARIGGDEFAVLLPGLDKEQAKTALERVRALEKLQPPVEGLYRLRLSLGCRTVSDPAMLALALKQADQLMYLQKASRLRLAASRPPARARATTPAQ